MKKHFILIFTVVIGLTIILSSCTKTVVNNEVYVDSYIHSINSRAGEPVYNVMHTAYSFSKIATVSVTGTSGAPINLTNAADNGFSFYTPLDTASYQLTSPAADSYAYMATYDDGTISTINNAIIATSVMPAKMLAVVKTASNIELSWKPVVNVQAYRIRIYSEDPNSKVTSLIYESGFYLPKDAISDLSIPFSLVSFSQYLSTNLTFEVSSFVFEDNSDLYQAISTAILRVTSL